jgi:hypothetical protein
LVAAVTKFDRRHANPVAANKVLLDYLTCEQRHAVANGLISAPGQMEAGGGCTGQQEQ